MIKFLTALYLRMRKVKGMVLNLQLLPNAIPRTTPCFYASVCLNFAHMLGTIFIFMVTYISISLIYLFTLAVSILSW